MNFYPKKINDRFNSPNNAGKIENSDAEGRWASFVCGISVDFSLQIEKETKEIAQAKFQTNGCGFVAATADFICEKITERELTQLHGLENLENEIEKELGEFPENRKHCAAVCFESLYTALAKYRTSQIEEWTGEKALICTCFGVSEERIEREIEENGLETVEQVGEVCNAGTGCGSCQPLIQEVLDSQNW